MRLAWDTRPPGNTIHERPTHQRGPVPLRLLHRDRRPPRFVKKNRQDGRETNRYPGHVRYSREGRRARGNSRPTQRSAAGNTHAVRRRDRDPRADEGVPSDRASASIAPPPPPKAPDLRAARSDLDSSLQRGPRPTRNQWRRKDDIAQDPGDARLAERWAGGRARMGRRAGRRPGEAHRRTGDQRREEFLLAVDRLGEPGILLRLPGPRRAGHSGPHRRAALDAWFGGSGSALWSVLERYAPPAGHRPRAVTAAHCSAPG